MTSSGKDVELELAAAECAEQLRAEFPLVAQRELLILAFMKGSLHGMRGAQATVTTEFAIAKAKR